MLKNLIFDSFTKWLDYLRNACCTFAKGACQLLLSIVFGIISLLIYCGKQIEAFCVREKVAAAIIAVVFFVLVFGWISTYMNGRIATKTAEYQRDSIGYKLDKYMQGFDSSSTIVVDKDTIRYGLDFKH